MTRTQNITGSIALTGGERYDLRAEYYNCTNPADAALEWTSASQKLEIVPQGVLFPANTPPTLVPVADAAIVAGQTLRLTNSASDPDVPAQRLTWSLATDGSGASINTTNGLLVWRPAISQSPSTNLFSVTVTDDGVPAMSATEQFSVAVLRPAMPQFSSPKFADGQFQSLIRGSAGPDYLVYASTNISGGWKLLLMTNPVTMPFLFVDSINTEFQQRYYRLQLGP